MREDQEVGSSPSLDMLTKEINRWCGPGMNLLMVSRILKNARGILTASYLGYLCFVCQ